MPQQDHRHAAIMFTDIAGYTALMGTDEDQAVEILKINREIHTKLIQQFNGTLIKEMGDGMLIRFDLASQAVRCAIEIQKACKVKAIPLKIGIHEGEMIFEGTDIIGNSVNIASRMQQDAEEGSINISSSVYKDIKNKSDINTLFLGEKVFKNLDEPVKIYKVLIDGEDRKPIVKEPNKRKRKYLYYILTGVVIVFSILLMWRFLPQQSEVELEKSIAVLPFRNINADTVSKYFADGQMEAILNHLTKIADLRVVSGTTMIALSSSKKSVSEIAKELQVNYILEGSVQKAGQNIRINAQLIDATVDDHMWSENFDRDLSDIFAIQTEIAISVAKELRATLSLNELKIIKSIPTKNLTAYDFYLKGVDYLSRGYTEGDTKYAIQMFNRAVEVDPKFTLAWVGLASSSRRLFWFNSDRSDERLILTKQYLDKAIALDPDLTEVQIEIGMYHYHCEYNYVKALQILEKQKEDYPRNDKLYLLTGGVYRRMGQFQIALANMDQAILLNASNWEHWFNAGQTLFWLRQYNKAEEYLSTAIKLNPSEARSYLMLAMVYLVSGQIEKADAFLNKNHNIKYQDYYYYIILSNTKLLERKYEEALKILDNLPNNKVINDLGVYSSKSLQTGIVYFTKSDRELAKAKFQEARSELEIELLTKAKHYQIYLGLALSYAGLGMREESITAYEKALSLMNMTIDAPRGFYTEFNIARIMLMIGDYEKSIAKLEYLLKQSGLISVELLKKDPFWDPLRELVTFNALIENPKFKINLDNNEGTKTMN